MRTALLGAVILSTTLAGVAAAVPATTASFDAGATGVRGAPVASLVDYGRRGTDVVDYAHGRHLTLTVPLRNTGRFDVTVMDVTLDGARLELLTQTSPAGSFALPAGSVRQVRLRAALGNCRWYHEREVRSYDGVRVRFRTVGGEGTRHVPFARPLLVHSPMIVGCPDRKLDRTVDNRRDVPAG